MTAPLTLAALPAGAQNMTGAQIGDFFRAAAGL